MAKKKVVVVGNCQARPIATLLEKMSDEIEVTKVAIVHLLKSEQEDEYLPFFEEADYIIAQLVNNDYPCDFVRTNNLKEKYNNKICLILNLYSNEQTPYLENLPYELRGRNAPMGDYQYSVIYNGWVNGLSVSKVVGLVDRDLKSVDFSTLEYKSLLEREAKVDVKIVDFLISKNTRSFHTFNHPTNELLIEYVERILRKLGIDTRVYERPEMEYLGQYVPFYRESKVHKVIGAKLLSTKSIVEEFYDFYNNFSECSIPNKIIQYWDGLDIPQDIKFLMDTWKLHNPNYEHIVFNKDSAYKFIARYYSEKIANAFYRCKIPAMQSDIFRVAYIYAKGGIYVDAASECKSSIDQFIYNRKNALLMRKWHGNIVNGFIASPPSNEFISNVWDKLVRNIFDIKKLCSNDVWSITGPKLYIELHPLAKKNTVEVLEQKELSSSFVWVNNLEHKKEKHWSKLQGEMHNIMSDVQTINKRLVIHIGQHKTGSTSIQRCAMKYRGNGFIYPDKGRKYSGHHDIPQMLAGISDEDFDVFCQDFISEVSQSECEYVLLSSEFMSSNNELHFDERYMTSIWRRLNTLAEKFSECKVVYFLREQSLSIESRINQSIKSRICTSKVDLNLICHNQSLDYFYFNNLLCKEFNNCEVVPLSYERSSFLNHDVCSEFFKRFLDVDVSYDDSNPRIPNLEASLICLKVNSLNASIDAKMRIKKAISEKFKSKDSRSILTQEQVKSIIDFYSDSNAKLKASSKSFSGFNKYLTVNKNIDIDSLIPTDSELIEIISLLIDSN